MSVQSRAAAARSPAAAAHAEEPEVVARALASNLRDGLDDAEAARRLAATGLNRVPRERRPPYARIALDQVRNPLVALLASAAGLSALLGEGVEAAVIASIVALNGLLGFVQEARAERAVIALRDAIGREATVVRGGRSRTIAAEDVVAGDLLVVNPGNRVAADARLIEAVGLEVDESLLTGESVPVAKSVAACPEAAPLADRQSMLFSGTGLTRGHGTALVTATGAATEVGQLVQLLASVRRLPTPLQRRLASLATLMTALGVAITAGLGLAVWAQGEPVEQAFLIGVAVAVAAVPEGLAASVTIALALGARAMAARGAIVRRIAAVETAGQTTVICSDKTGTLTENQLRIAGVAATDGVTREDVLEVALLASTAIESDPVESAIADAGAAYGLRSPAEPPLHEIPFDAVRKRLTVVRSAPGGRIVLAKGAPELLFDRAVDADPALEQTAHAWAEEGLRVLAVARRTLDDQVGLGEEELERDLVVIGLLALHDPLRETAAAAIAGARELGIEIEMLTGDHPVTARAVGQTLGIPESRIHARITPADKLAIVEALQLRGEVVAVTGDGVNDAPALRRADVGIAMGRSGAEAAREASDIVLTNDDFATVVAAVQEGRRIFDNIRKFVAFLLSANLGEVVLFTVAILAGLGAPMTVVQILIINLLTDGLPAVALARDPLTVEGGVGRGRHGHLLPGRLWVVLGAVGLLVGSAAFAAYAAGRGLGGDVEQTMAFATVGLGELLLVFSCRSVRAAAWRVPQNRYLLASVLGSLVILVGAVYLPVHEGLGTVALGPAAAGVVVGLALVPAAVVELAKAVARHRVE